MPDNEWRQALTACFETIGIDLTADFLPHQALADDIRSLCSGVPEFANADLATIKSFSLYRTLLYATVRAVQPELIFETGILNGFGSAFLLQALEDNGRGRLVSIDLPHTDGDYKDQGTMLLPKGKMPGWAIPERLRHRHTMIFGGSEVLLPLAADEHGSPQLFVHDSDHRYPHLMMEISLMWSRMRGGIIIADNVEQNSAFADFCRGVGAQNAVVSSYNSPERTWQHGLIRK